MEQSAKLPKLSCRRMHIRKPISIPEISWCRYFWDPQYPDHIFPNLAYDPQAPGQVLIHFLHE